MCRLGYLRCVALILAAGCLIALRARNSYADKGIGLAANRGLELEPASYVSPSVTGELRALEREVGELRRRDAEKTKQIERLERRVHEPSSKLPPELDLAAPLWVSSQQSAPDQPTDSKSALDRAIEELQGQVGTEPSQPSPLEQAIRGLPQQPIATAPAPGGAQLQLLDISWDVLFALGTSTEKEASIQQLEGGDHDPHKRGFTIQNAELFLAGAVDPYLDGAANIVYFIDPEGESVLELEEAYMTTRSLPHGLQVKAGQFFTEFGRINAQHPHTWHWIDQPIINSRIFGPDGMRGPGARVSWLMPTEQFSELFVGIQNANGETMSHFFASEEFFDERPVGGRPFVDQDVRDLGDLMYWARWQTSWTTHNEEATWLFGLSGAFGPNATGPDGNTQIYGADLTMKWKPAKNERGWPFVIWETEAIASPYRSDNFRDTGDPLDATDDVVLRGAHLTDWGIYTEVLWGFKLRWAAGLRFEYADASGDSLDEDLTPISHNDDPFRDERYRLSPLVTFQPTEFSRVRFQYNFDNAFHIDGRDAHSFWLGMEWLYGAHAAHKF